MNDLQACILDIYNSVKELCESNKIPFFAIGGTCIGAVRHHGFVPWDDDLDIAIPIEYFWKFEKLARENLPSYLKVYSNKDIEHYEYMHIKVINTTTTYIEPENVKYPDSYKGVFVDVMPLSGIPSSKIKKRMFYIWLRLLSKLNHARRWQPEEMDTKGKIALSRILHTMDSLVPYYFFSEQWYKLLANHPLHESLLTGYVWNKKIQRLIFPSEWFREGVEMEFENTTIYCPVCYNEYLTYQFGEYMKYPPLEEQVSIHDGYIDLDSSYVDYANGLKSVNKLVEAW